jgi:hypothetical protein
MKAKGTNMKHTLTLLAAAPDQVSTRPELVITTLGFGSCARQDRPQPIWDKVNVL